MVKVIEIFSHLLYNERKNKIGVVCVNVNVGDIVEMKKPHPCGCKRFVLLRVGMDFKIKCENCGHEIMLPRSKCEKNIKKVFPKD